MSLDEEKQAAARAAADLVQNGMTIGLGTGSTAAHLLTAIAARSLDIRCVASSPRTDAAARALGLRLEDMSSVSGIDLTIDGADVVAPDFWLIKGGGGAHTREKIVAAAADRFIVIGDSSKPVERLAGTVPLELLRFGLAATLSHLGPVALRDVPASPDGGVIADWSADLSQPEEIAAFLSSTPGVIAHGLFPPSMVSGVIIGRGSDVEWLERR